MESLDTPRDTPRFAPAAGAPRPWSLQLALGAFLASPWALALALLLAFFLGAGTLPLTDVDEGAFTEATREMLARGNLVSPTLNDLPRHDKPILIYWAQAAAVGLLGQGEFAFRLPSLLASLLWVAALYRFCLRHGDRPTATTAALVMSLSLLVGVVAKAAIADALLNLFVALALFWIYDYFHESRQGAVPRWRLPGIYAALGLGFLAKGPVAVFFPLLISGLFFVSAASLRRWLDALRYWPGWLLFLAIVLPWHVLVYLDQGEAFFRGFYLQHNLNRYANTFEGHGGNPLYYALVLPFVLLPFTGWLLAITGPLLRRAWAGRPGQLAAALPPVLLERYLLLWFAVVFVFFSFSRTQLPHYLLYGCSPLFVLLARRRAVDDRRWLAFVPALASAALLAALPWLLELAVGRVGGGLESILLAGLAASFDDAARGLLPCFALAVLGLAVWRRLPVWQGLLLAGLLQAAVVAGVVAPRVLEVSQGPVREAGLLARQLGLPVVAWRLSQPSFSVYRQAATPARLPVAGELVLTRRDRLDELRRSLAPLVVHEIYGRGFVSLGRVDTPEAP